MFATVARICAAHRRWVLAVWMLLLVIGFAAGAMTFNRLKDSSGSGSSESARGTAILNKATSMGPTASGQRGVTTHRQAAPSGGSARNLTASYSSVLECHSTGSAGASSGSGR